MPVYRIRRQKCTEYTATVTAPSASHALDQAIAIGEWEVGLTRWSHLDTTFVSPGREHGVQLPLFPMLHNDPNT